MVSDRPAVRMGGQKGAAGHFSHLPEAGVVKVGDIHHHPQLLHPGHRFPAKGGETHLAVAAAAKLVGGVPGEGHHLHPLFPKAVQHLNASAQGRAPLHRKDGGPLPLRQDPFQLLRGPHLAD